MTRRTSGQRPGRATFRSCACRDRPRDHGRKAGIRACLSARKTTVHGSEEVIIRRLEGEGTTVVHGRTTRNSRFAGFRFPRPGLPRARERGRGSPAKRRRWRAGRPRSGQGKRYMELERIVLDGRPRGARDITTGYFQNGNDHRSPTGRAGTSGIFRPLRLRSVAHGRSSAGLPHADLGDSCRLRARGQGKGRGALFSSSQGAFGASCRRSRGRCGTWLPGGSAAGIG